MTIKERIEQLTDIPTIPIVISRLVKVLQNEKASVAELTDVIKYDQSLAERIVAVANSPFLGYPGRINSIEQAVLMLGFDLVKTLSLGVSVIGIFPHHSLALKQIWSHSFGVATLAGLMSSKMPAADKGVCFLAGLLHDIGHVIFMQFAKESYEEVLKSSDINSCEAEIFGCTHAEAGRWFLESLSFPGEIVLPVFYHHDIEGATIHKGIITTVYLAEGMISLLNHQRGFDGIWSEEHHRIYKENSLGDKELKECEEFLTEEDKYITNFFDL